MRAELRSGLKPPALFEKHRSGISRFHTHKHTEALPLERALEGVARHYD